MSVRSRIGDLRNNEVVKNSKSSFLPFSKFDYDFENGMASIFYAAVSVIEKKKKYKAVKEYMDLFTIIKSNIEKTYHLVIMESKKNKSSIELMSNLSEVQEIEPPKKYKHLRNRRLSLFFGATQSDFEIEFENQLKYRYFKSMLSQILDFNKMYAITSTTTDSLKNVRRDRTRRTQRVKINHNPIARKTEEVNYFYAPKKNLPTTTSVPLQGKKTKKKKLLGVSKSHNSWKNDMSKLSGISGGYRDMYFFQIPYEEWKWPEIKEWLNFIYIFHPRKKKVLSFIKYCKKHTPKKVYKHFKKYFESPDHSLSTLSRDIRVLQSSSHPEKNVNPLILPLLNDRNLLLTLKSEIDSLKKIKLQNKENRFQSKSNKCSFNIDFFQILERFVDYNKTTIFGGSETLGNVIKALKSSESYYYDLLDCRDRILSLMMYNMKFDEYVEHLESLFYSTCYNVLFSVSETEEEEEDESDGEKKEKKEKTPIECRNHLISNFERVEGDAYEVFCEKFDGLFGIQMDSFSYDLSILSELSEKKKELDSLKLRVEKLTPRDLEKKEKNMKKKKEVKKVNLDLSTKGWASLCLTEIKKRMEGIKNSVDEIKQKLKNIPKDEQEFEYPKNMKKHKRLLMNEKLLLMQIRKKISDKVVTPALPPKRPPRRRGRTGPPKRPPKRPSRPPKRPTTSKPTTRRPVPVPKETQAIPNSAPPKDEEEEEVEVEEEDEEIEGEDVLEEARKELREVSEKMSLLKFHLSEASRDYDSSETIFMSTRKRKTELRNQLLSQFEIFVKRLNSSELFYLNEFPLCICVYEYRPKHVNFNFVNPKKSLHALDGVEIHFGTVRIYWSEKQKVLMTKPLYSCVENPQQRHETNVDFYQLLDDGFMDDESLLDAIGVKREYCASLSDFIPLVFVNPKSCIDLVTRVAESIVRFNINHNNSSTLEFAQTLLRDISKRKKVEEKGQGSDRKSKKKKKEEEILGDQKTGFALKELITPHFFTYLQTRSTNSYYFYKNEYVKSLESFAKDDMIAETDDVEFTKLEYFKKLEMVKYRSLRFLRIQADPKIKDPKKEKEILDEVSLCQLEMNRFVSEFQVFFGWENESERKYQGIFQLDDGNRLVFRNHSHLDYFYFLCCEKMNSGSEKSRYFELEFPHIHQLLKSYDRAFWMNRSCNYMHNIRIRGKYQGKLDEKKIEHEKKVFMNCPFVNELKDIKSFFVYEEDFIMKEILKDFEGDEEEVEGEGNN